MDDRQLRQRVIDELEFEPSVNAAHIGVSVHDGVVTLTGHVSWYGEKFAAVRATRWVKDVHAIADEIEVRRGGSQTVSDDEIATRALRILEWYGIVPQNDIKVTVEKGVVSLTGTASWQHQRQAAEDAVRQLAGVTGLINVVSIKPAVESTNVQSQIEDALRRRTAIDAQAVRVTVGAGNRVVLYGKVGNWHQREAVEKAAWSVAGVTSVDDRLTIAG